MCTIAAPALAASMPESAICLGVTGTAGFLPGVSAAPVKAQAIITFRAMLSSSAEFGPYYRRAFMAAQVVREHHTQGPDWLLVEPGLIDIERSFRLHGGAREVSRWRRVRCTLGRSLRMQK